MREIKFKTKSYTPKIELEFDSFVCDGCGEVFTNEESIEVSTPQLAGIVMCKECMKEDVTNID